MDEEPEEHAHCDHYDYETGGDWCCKCYRVIAT